MMRITGCLAAIVAAVVVSACDEGSADDLREPESVAEWSIGDQPQFFVGDLDGPEAIGRLPTGHPDFRPSRAVFLSGGRIAMADAASSEIRVFDDTGTRIRTLGRSGTGPGEFRALMGIAAFAGGDSIAAWENSAMRRGRVITTRFATDGPIEPNVLTLDSGGFDEVIGLHDDGSVLVAETTTTLLLRREYEGDGRDVFEVRQLTRNGEVATVRGPFEGAKWVFGRPARLAPVFPSPTTTMAVGADRFYAGDTESFGVEVYEVNSATPRHRLTAQVSPRRISATETERLRERTASMVATPAAAGLTIPIPETYPVFTQVIPDTDGNVWVVDQWVEDGGATAWIFGPAGDLIAKASIPEGFTVEAVGGDRVLVSSMDELQVVRLSVHPVLKRAED